MKKRFLVLGLTLVMVMTLIMPSVALAANPEVLITVSAKAISITNTQTDWAIGSVEVGDIRWFNSDSTVQLDTYSQIENTGNVAVDIQIQGTNFGGGFPWTLAGTAGDKIYSLYANSESTPLVYDVEVKSSSYTDLTLNLTASDTYDWSMKFTAPTVFDAGEDFAQKSSTLTLIARQQGT